MALHAKIRSCKIQFYLQKYISITYCRSPWSAIYIKCLCDQSRVILHQITHTIIPKSIALCDLVQEAELLNHFFNSFFTRSDLTLPDFCDFLHISISKLSQAKTIVFDVWDALLRSIYQKNLDVMESVHLYGTTVSQSSLYY